MKMVAGGRDMTLSALVAAIDTGRQGGNLSCGQARKDARWL
jgi:hypothetical protein